MQPVVPTWIPSKLMGHLPARLPDLLNQQRVRARHAKVVPDEPTGALVDGFLGLEYAAARLQGGTLVPSYPGHCRQRNQSKVGSWLTRTELEYQNT